MKSVSCVMIVEKYSKPRVIPEMVAYSAERISTSKYAYLLELFNFPHLQNSIRKDTENTPIELRNLKTQGKVIES